MADESLTPKDRESFYSSSPTAPTIYYARTDIVMAHFSEDELDSVASTNPSASFGFFGVCAGVFGSFLGILLSTDITTPWKHASCIMLTAGFGLLALFFLYRSIADSKVVRDRLAGLKKRFGKAQ